MSDRPKHAGDVMVTSGGSHASNFIRFITCSPWSHVAITAYVTHKDLCHHFPKLDWTCWVDQTLVFESTSDCHRICTILGKELNGLQSHQVLKWIATHGGKIYRMRLLEEMTKEESQRLTDYLLSNLKKEIPYDWGGAILAGTRLIKWFPCMAKWANNRHSRFCVETVETVLQACFYDRELPPFDPGRDRPRDLVRKLSKSGLWSKPNRLH